MDKTGLGTSKLASFETERLKLRLMTKDEWSIFVDRVIKADEVNYTFACDPDETFFKFVTKTNFGNSIDYSIFLQDTDEMIGYIGFCVDAEHPDNNNLSYYIFKEHRRNGYAYEVVTALIDKIMNGDIVDKKIDVILAWVLVTNKPSANLLEKIGFKDGYSRMLDNLYIQNGYRYGAIDMDEEG